jgi:hypothetical protein
MSRHDEKNRLTSVIRHEKEERAGTIAWASVQTPPVGGAPRLGLKSGMTATKPVAQECDAGGARWNPVNIGRGPRGTAKPANVTEDQI